MEPPSNRRLLLVYLILCSALVGLGGRLAWLQIFQSKELKTLALSFQTSSTKPLGQRRTIVDRMGRLVAIDEQRFTLWAHPRYFNFPGDEPQAVRKPADVADRKSVV